MNVTELKLPFYCSFKKKLTGKQLFIQKILNFSSNQAIFGLSLQGEGGMPESFGICTTNPRTKSSLNLTLTTTQKLKDCMCRLQKHIQTLSLMCRVPYLALLFQCVLPPNQIRSCFLCTSSIIQEIGTTDTLFLHFGTLGPSLPSNHKIYFFGNPRYL